MASHGFLLLLGLLGTCWCGLVASYYEQIFVDNGLPWLGGFGDDDLCLDTWNQSYAFALDFKFQTMDHLDNTAGNGVKLFCKDPAGYITNYVTSTVGQSGNWQGTRSCPEDHYIVGFRLRVFPEQGTWGDDFAVDNIQVQCSDGTILDGMDGTLPSLHNPRQQDDRKVRHEWVELKGRKAEVVRTREILTGPGQTRLHGEWGSWAQCSLGRMVVGIQTIVQQQHPFEDDAGLCDVILLCL